MPGGFDLVINGGVVVLPDSVAEINLGITGGRISVLSQAPLDGNMVLDVPGMVVLPGVIDSHLHFQLYQGQGENRIVTVDDYESGPLQAAHGGVTTFVDYVIPADRPIFEEVALRREAASQTSCIDFAFHAAIAHPAPERLQEIGQLLAAGITSFKFFTTYKEWGVGVDLGFLYAAFLEIARGGGMASVHCENDEIVEYLRELYHGRQETELIYHSLSRPDFSEALAVEEAIMVAHEAGVPLHVVHLSSKKGLEVIRHALSQGDDVTTETCPHYLAFTDEVLREERGFRFTMTPPLRPAENAAALWEGVVDGSISLLGSDHNGFSLEQKLDPGRQDFYSVAPGVPGTETLLPFAFTEGYLAGRIDLPRLAALLASNPAARFGLPNKGRLQVGYDADVVIVDPAERRMMGPSVSYSPSGYSIFDGVELAGWPRYTISRGEMVFAEDRFVGELSHGRFLTRHPRTQLPDLVSI